MSPAFLEIVLLIQLVACAAMTGVIWIVQVAIYPLFGQLSGEAFQRYHDRYMHLVTFVIAPLMLLEVVSCGLLLFLGNWKEMLIPAVLLGLIWASTAFIQVPQHKRLIPSAVPALVRGNWLRTCAWSLRTLLLASLVLRG